MLKTLSDKAKKIIDGWGNYAFPSENIEKLAKVRAQICSQCPEAKWSKFKAMVITDKKIKEIEGYVCGKCNCPLSGKVRSVNEKCPNENW